MSRIGRMPIAIPAGVTVEIAENNHVTVKGARFPGPVKYRVAGETCHVRLPQ